MRILKNILLYTFISSLIMMSSSMLQSDFLVQFLHQNLLTILIALLGLNIAVLAILVTKLSESKHRYHDLDINEITSEMRFSLLELFVNIGVAGAVSIFVASEVIVFCYKELICSSLLLSTLIYSLVIVWDTGNSIFVLIREEDNTF